MTTATVGVGVTTAAAGVGVTTAAAAAAGVRGTADLRTTA